MIFKQIPDHSTYAATSDGKIFSITQKEGLKELKRDLSTGYPRVTMDGQKVYVSTAVAHTFLDFETEEKKGYKIFYIDGDPENCGVNNLTYLSPSDIQRYSQYTVEYRRQVLGVSN